MNKLKLASLLALVVLVGCKVQVIAPEGGKVTWGDNQVCESGSVCTIPLDDLPFDETFVAVAAPGYEFVGWADGSGFLCGKSKLTTCTLKINDDPLGEFITSSLQSTYAMPLLDVVGDCTNLPPNVECGYPIADSVGVPRYLFANVFIPKGKIIASSFSTTSLQTDSGAFSFEVEPSFPTPQTDIWISRSPGGSALSSACSQTKGVIVYGLTYSQVEWNDCVLETNQLYYLNMQHSDPAQPRSSVLREFQGTAYNATAYDCTNLPPNVECGENIPDSVFGETREYVTIFNIPGSGKTVAQAFKTTNRSTSYGKFDFLDVPGEAFTPARNFWVSLSPGGKAISQRCLGERTNVHGTMRWMIPDLEVNWCDLEPNQDYYLNVSHWDAADTRTSRVRRKVRVGVL